MTHLDYTAAFTSQHTAQLHSEPTNFGAPHSERQFFLLLLNSGKWNKKKGQDHQSHIWFTNVGAYRWDHSLTFAGSTFANQALLKYGSVQLASVRVRKLSDWFCYCKC